MRSVAASTHEDIITLLLTSNIGRSELVKALHPHPEKHKLEDIERLDCRTGITGISKQD